MSQINWCMEWVEVTPEQFAARELLRIKEEIHTLEAARVYFESAKRTRPWDKIVDDDLAFIYRRLRELRGQS